MTDKLNMSTPHEVTGEVSAKIFDGITLLYVVTVQSESWKNASLSFSGHHHRLTLLFIESEVADLAKH